MERPLALQAGKPVELKILVDGTLCEVYAGGQVAMSARMYDHPTGNWGLFVQEGAAQFENPALRTPLNAPEPAP